MMNIRSFGTLLQNQISIVYVDITITSEKDKEICDKNDDDEDPNEQKNGYQIVSFFNTIAISDK